MIDAALGAKLDVPTVDGVVKMSIPAGSQSGSLFRLKNRGAPDLRRRGLRGDQIVRLQVTLPEDADADLQRFVEGWAAGKRYDPRKKLHG